MESSARQPAAINRRGNYRWVWFFAILAVLTVLAIGIELWFNLQQQFKRPDLDAARVLWNARGPGDYDLEYTKKGSTSGTVVVQVRGGKVVSATLDGQPLEPRLYPFYEMAGLFDDLERFLDMDSVPDSPRTFTTAQFDPEDGHLIHYLRSVTSTRQRIEITVRLRPLGVDASPGPTL